MFYTVFPHDEIWCTSGSGSTDPFPKISGSGFGSRSDPFHKLRSSKNIKRIGSYPDKKKINIDGIEAFS
jgi:hypothetical protein